MAKKKRVAFNRTEDLAAVDSELDTAMERLDDSNDRIGEILSRFEAERQPFDPEGGVPPGNDNDGGRAEEPAASEAGSAQGPVQEVDTPEEKG